MAYSNKVIEHNRNPSNVGSLDAKSNDVGTGLVGSPACGDVLKLQLLVLDGIIADVKFKTFGCGSAIAASSLATEMLKGKTLEEAEKMTENINETIAGELCLPPVKHHCSVLARGAIKSALHDYRAKQERQHEGEHNG